MPHLGTRGAIDDKVHCSALVDRDNRELSLKCQAVGRRPSGMSTHMIPKSMLISLITSVVAGSNNSFESLLIT